MITMLNGTLKPTHREAGLSLYSKDNGKLYLESINSEVIHEFEPGTHLTEIFEEADRWLKQKDSKGNLSKDKARS